MSEAPSSAQSANAPHLPSSMSISRYQMILEQTLYIMETTWRPCEYRRPPPSQMTDAQFNAAFRIMLDALQKQSTIERRTSNAQYNVYMASPSVVSQRLFINVNLHRFKLPTLPTRVVSWICQVANDETVVVPLDVKWDGRYTQPTYEHASTTSTASKAVVLSSTMQDFPTGTQIARTCEESIPPSTTEPQSSDDYEDDSNSDYDSDCDSDCESDCDCDDNMDGTLHLGFADKKEAQAFWASLMDTDRDLYSTYIHAYNDCCIEYRQYKQTWRNFKRDCPFPFGSKILGAKYGTWDECKEEFETLTEEIANWAEVHQEWTMWKRLKAAERRRHDAITLIKDFMIPEIKQIRDWDRQQAERKRYNSMPIRVDAIVFEEEDNLQYGVTWKNKFEHPNPNLEGLYFQDGAFIAKVLEMGHFNQWHFAGNIDAPELLNVFRRHRSSPPRLSRIEDIMNMPPPPSSLQTKAGIDQFLDKCGKIGGKRLACIAFMPQNSPYFVVPGSTGKRKRHDLPDDTFAHPRVKFNKVESYDEGYFSGDSSSESDDMMNIDVCGWQEDPMDIDACGYQEDRTIINAHGWHEEAVDFSDAMDLD